MADFSEIQVGDTVLVPEYVTWGWGNKSSFLVPAKVTRLTKTMFEVGEKGKYRKSNGYKHGGVYGERAWREGDSRGRHTSKATDETAEMKAFCDKLLAVHAVKKELGRAYQGSTNINIHCSDDKLSRMRDALRVLNGIIYGDDEKELL